MEEVALAALRRLHAAVQVDRADSEKAELVEVAVAERLQQRGTELGGRDPHTSGDFCVRSFFGTIPTVSGVDSEPPREVLVEQRREHRRDPPGA